MAFDQFVVQRARFAIEDVDASEDNYAADLTGDVGANFEDLRHEAFRVMRGDLVTQDTTVVQRPYQRRNHVIGPSRASCQIPGLWTGTAEAITAAVTPTQTTQSKILEAVFGGYHADSGSLVVASPSPTTTSATVTTSEGANFTKGQIAAIGASAAAALPVLITNVSSDALTWWPALPAAPATSDIVYGAQTIYCDSTSKQTIQVLMEMAVQRGNIWGGLGGSPQGFAFDWSRDALAKWSLDLAFAKYLHDDELATPQGGSAIAAATYTGAPVYVAEGGCILTATSGSTRTQVKAASIAVNFGGAAARFEVGYHAGVEGLGAPERNTRDEITVELTLLKPDPYEDYHDAFTAETDYGLMFWMAGAGAGSGRVFTAPACMIAAPPEPVEAFGLEGQKLTLLVKENSKTSSPTTAQHYSPFTLGHY
jgi:hypothetical protein